MRLLQVSDTHFGAERPAVAAGLVRLAETLRPDVVLFSGDITQRATPAQFEQARRFGDTLTRRAQGDQPPATLLAVAGNHDIPLFNPLARALWPYRRLHDAFGPALRSAWDAPTLQLTLLNSTRPWRHRHGELSPAQIGAVSARLAQATPQQLRVVVAHHPLAVLRTQDRLHLARNHELALDAWAAAGVDLVLGGHIHLPYLLPLHERRPALARRLWVLQAGTAISRRIRHEADNSVNLVCVPDAAASAAGGARLAASTRRCRVERWDWQPAAQAFARVQAHELSCQMS